MYKFVIYTQFVHGELSEWSYYALSNILVFPFSGSWPFLYTSHFVHRIHLVVHRIVMNMVRSAVSSAAGILVLLVDYVSI